MPGHGHVFLLSNCPDTDSLCCQHPSYLFTDVDREGTKTLISQYRYDDYGQLLEMTNYRVSSETETRIVIQNILMIKGGRITAFAEIGQNAQPTADDIKAHQIRYTYNKDQISSRYPIRQPKTESVLSCIMMKTDGCREIKENCIQGADNRKSSEVIPMMPMEKSKRSKDYRNLLKRQ